MSEIQTLKGRCLCGAVTVTAKSAAPQLNVCHCDMCRRHTSAMFMSVTTEPGSLQVEGPAKSFVSSEWAERGFCEVCGSTLWYGTTEDGMRHPAAGLFDDAAHATMELEFFVDQCPSGYALKGDHTRLDTDQTIAMFSEGEADG